MKLDTDLALGFASHYCKIGTMECLVDDGNAEAFLGPLMRAAERGYMEVSRQWQLIVIFLVFCSVLVDLVADTQLSPFYM
jgi:hypothetical protein